MKIPEWVFLLSIVGVLVDSLLLFDGTERAFALLFFLALLLVSGLAMFSKPFRS